METGKHSALCAALLVVATPVFAAELPAHDPLSVIVVGDEVNPHGLSAAQLTQPQDIGPALEASDSGLALAGNVTLVDSQCVDQALTWLAAATPPSVLIYFAHRAAHHCDSSAAQVELTAAIEDFLIAGGGVVVFHHGLYVDSGKEALLQLIGGQASSIAWDTSTGQRVFAVSPDHFIATQGMHYAGQAALTGAGAIPSGTFPYYDNVPDERYPATQLLTVAGETRELIFATSSGGTRVLGYSLVRSGWTGRVVAWQPAEYQPNALDDRGGNDFQILANSIVFAAREDAPTEPPVPSAKADGCSAIPPNLLWFGMVALMFRRGSRTAPR